MAQRLTPIERAIADDPADRRDRYDHRMRKKGFTRATFWTHPEDAQLVQAIARKLRECPGSIEEVRQLIDGAPGAARTERSEGARARRSGERRR